MRIANFLFLQAALVSIPASEVTSQWTQTAGMDNLTVTCLARQGTYLFAGTNVRGIYWSTDGGANWSQRSNGLSDTLVRALVSSDGILIAGTEQQGIFRSTDNGANWILSNIGIENHRILSLATTNGIIFAGTYNMGAYRSTDQGAVWNPINNGLPTSGFVRSLAICDSGLFAGMDFGVVIRSTNNGSNWQLVNLPTTSGWVAAITIKGSTILASTDGTSNVFRSTNWGSSWHDADSGMMAPGVYSFAVTEDVIFAGTYWGFYVTTDDGLSWTEKSEGFSDKTLYALLATDAHLLTGGFAKGVWRRPLSEIITSVNGEQDQIPANFMLHQNYPNPSNPTTTITFSLSSRSVVSLKVYDALGREVSLLVSEELTPGTYIRRWNAADLTSGVYFYRLEAGSFRETKKLVLIK